MATAWREGRDHAVRQVEQQIMDGYPKRLPLGEKCPHGVLNGADCIGCYDEALMTRLTAIRKTEPTPTILDAALSALGEAGYEVTRKTDVDFRYRLADLLRDLHQRKPEAIDAAGEVIAFFRAAMLSASQEQSEGCGPPQDDGAKGSDL